MAELRTGQTRLGQYMYGRVLPQSHVPVPRGARYQPDQLGADGSAPRSAASGRAGEPHT